MLDPQIVPEALWNDILALLDGVPAGSAYAGVGSRETPLVVQQAMEHIAAGLRARGYILRSGAADGADAAFERGAAEAKEIFLPWRAFSESPSRLYWVPREALDMAVQFHPMGEALRERRGMHKLMARNCQQVLGKDLKAPSRAVLCWTPDGANGTTVLTTGRTGGTGQAIRIAAAHRVPVLNFNAYFPGAVALPKKRWVPAAQAR